MQLLYFETRNGSGFCCDWVHVEKSTLSNVIMDQLVSLDICSYIFGTESYNLQ